MLIAICLSLSLGGAEAPALRIIDGDTVALGEERIRLIGIDAPEHGGRAECRAEELLGELAARRLAEILQEELVAIDRHGRDYFGRTLARIETSGGDVGERLLQEGYAEVYDGRRFDWCAGEAAADE